MSGLQNIHLNGRVYESFKLSVTRSSIHKYSNDFEEVLALVRAVICMLFFKFVQSKVVLNMLETWGIFTVFRVEATVI